MQDATFFYITFAIRIALWVYVLAKGVWEKLLRPYHLIWAFIIAFALADVTRFIAVSFLGNQSTTYLQIYLSSEWLVRALALAVLLRYYFYPREISFRSIAVVVIALPAIVLLEWLLPRQSHPALRVLNIVFFYQAILAVLTIVRLFRHRITIGKNVGYVLASLAFPACIRSIINALYLLDSDIWSYDFINIGLEFADVVSWLIIAVGFKIYDPPSKEQEPKMEAREARRRIAELTKTLEAKKA